MLAAAACGRADLSDDDARGHDDAGAEHAPSDRDIAFRRGDPVSLRFREEYRFVVLVEDASGPVAGASIDLGLEGDVRDATLGESRIETGAEGTAEGLLIAGSVDASFRLRASLATGEAALLQVRVGPPGGAEIRVLPVYDGPRVVERYDLRILPGASCPAVRGLPPDDSELVVSVDASTPAFPAPGEMLLSPVRLVLVGRDRGIDLLWGCEAGVLIPLDGIDAIEIALADLPWPRPGAHDLDAGVLLGLHGTPAAQAALAPFAALMEGSVSQGRFVVDGVVGALRASGNTAAASVLSERAAIDGLDEAISGDLSRRGIDIGAALRGAASSASAFLASARVAGAVVLGEPDEAGRARGAVRWSVLSAGSVEIPISGGAGVVEDPDVGILFEADALVLGRHEMPMPLGRAVGSVLANALDPTTAAWTGRPAEPGALDALLAAAVNCDAIAEILRAAADLYVLCNVDCLGLACRAWLVDLAAASAAPLDAADAAASEVDLTGRCSFLLDDGRLAPGGRCDGTVRGWWIGSERLSVDGPLLVVPGAGP